jgi:transcriptional regulator with XRE-family HTH domain
VRGAFVSSADEQRRSVGKRVREIRKSRGLSLRKLAELSDVSASFVSQLERGDSGANVSTLVGIATALRVSVGDLFTDGSPSLARLHRRQDRPELDRQHGYRKTLLTQRLDSPMEVYGGEFEVGGSTGPRTYVHGDAHEVVVVIRGQVLLQLGEQYFSMREGDSLEFQSSTPHRVANRGTEPAEVLWIVSPPTEEIEFVDASEEQVAGTQI